MDEKIVALDIGTRSVVGIVLENIQNSYKVIELVSIEHEERSMLDGQIHDILSVSKIIKEVKLELEEKHGPITRVCVAAAGRALKTKQTSFTKNIKSNPLINTDDVLHMELSAVQQAQVNLANEENVEKSTNYYCAGYSVLHYKLDGEEIGSLIDQQGDIAEVEIIATFLPKVVVESLISALQRADLEMDALTLEPIAAINVLIPPSMRRLNVALVDIGAGTSDVAITNFGTVIGYGMVPIAGDEITEAISNHYLLDFPLAEKAKREVTSNSSTKIIDILGFETEVTIDELSTNIEPAIDQLAEGICEEILRLNHKPPQAVMLVGGGSLTPNLTKRIAERLRLPENRVAIRGTSAIQNLVESDVLPEGPAFVTPVGIAIAARLSPVHYVSVTVNKRTVRLFDLKQLTIGDALLAAGIQINKLYGKPGMALIVKLNGKDITIPGMLGNPPIIQKNGEHVTLNTPIKHGDCLVVQHGEDGQSPHLTLSELTDGVTVLTINFNDEKYQVKPDITINGIKANSETVLKDGDRINITRVQTVKKFLENINQLHLLNNFKPFTIQINNQETQIADSICTIYVNNKISTPETNIKENDNIKIFKQQSLLLGELIQKLDYDLYEELPIQYESKPIILKKPIKEFYRNGQKLTENDSIYHGDSLTLSSSSSEPFIFQDIFRYIDFDVSRLKGKQFKLYINGIEAAFSSPLTPNDKVSIRWIESIFTK